MKIYRNKLYSIQDAAKRSGTTIENIWEMIDENVIKGETFLGSYIFRGEDIPGLKKKWIEYQRTQNIGKGGKNKKLNKTKVTHLRMDKGE